MCEVKARRRRHTLCLASRRNDDIRARSAFSGVCFLVSTGLSAVRFLRQPTGKYGENHKKRAGNARPYAMGSCSDHARRGDHWSPAVRPRSSGEFDDFIEYVSLDK